MNNNNNNGNPQSMEVSFKAKFNFENKINKNQCNEGAENAKN